MNSKEEFTIQMKTKVAEIEEILKRYLPEAEGYQKGIMEAMEYSLMAVSYTHLAFMNQFAGTLQNRQVASVGFYMIYMLLAALTVAAFDVVLKWVESGIRNITAFMGVFYPVYFLAVAVAKGSVTGVAFRCV